MRIAFDLDDTLIGCCHDFPAETRGVWARVLARERLRAGTVDLIRELRRRGHEVWIYTSSFRSPLGIRLLFWTHGVVLGGIVTQTRHDREVVRALGAAAPGCAKHPPSFGIEVQVDDSEGIALEGQAHGFVVVSVRPDEPDWTAEVLGAIERLARAASGPGQPSVSAAATPAANAAARAPASTRNAPAGERSARRASGANQGG